MKTYNANQIKDLAGQYNYRLAEIVDQDGNKPIPGQQVKETTSKWISSKVIPFTQRNNVKGVYYVRCYSDSNKKTKPDVYPLAVNMSKAELENLSEAPAPPVVHVVLPDQKPVKENKDNPLTWESALQYQQQISNLQSKCNRLELENDMLKKQLAEAEEEGEQSLSENSTNNFWSSLVPVADNFFSDRKQQRAMQFFTLANQNPDMWKYQHLFVPGAQPGMNGNGQPHIKQPQQPQQPKQPQPAANSAEQEQINAVLEKSQVWLDQQSDEIYQAVEQVRLKTKSAQEFFNQLSQEQPDIYKALYDYINS